MNERYLNVVGALVVALYDELTESFAEAGVPNSSVASALATLHSDPGDGIDALSRVLGLTASGAVRLVCGLADRGLIDKRPGRDGRAVSLHLTRAGNRLAERVLAKRRHHIRAALAGLSAAEQREFGELSGRIVAKLTRKREGADRICRLCDDSVCPDRHCPVEQAVPK